MAFQAMLLIDRLARRDGGWILSMAGFVESEETEEDGRYEPEAGSRYYADWHLSVSNPDQLFLVVLAMKLVISCSNRLLPHAGQVAWPLSCSFSVMAMRDSFPHSRHL